jgi:hypothetical protein
MAKLWPVWATTQATSAFSFDDESSAFNVRSSHLPLSPWRFNLSLFPSMFDVQCSMFNVQCSMFNVQCSMFNVQCSMFNVQCSRIFHTSPAFTIVPAGTSAPRPTNAPAATQQPSPIPIGSVTRSKLSLRKS